MAPVDGARNYGSSRSIQKLATTHRGLVELLPKDCQYAFDDCTTPADLLDDLKSLDIIKENPQVLSRIENFVDTIWPFFQAMDVLCQSEPIYAGTVWGGIRIAIQVCTERSRVV
jgi:hypothetical protein